MCRPLHNVLPRFHATPSLLRECHQKEYPVSPLPLRLKPQVVQHQVYALVAHFDDPSFARCARNAIKYVLGTMSLPWTFTDGILTIQSASGTKRRQVQTYSCDGAACPCHARPSRANPTGWCWHLAAWHIINAISTITDPFQRNTAEASRAGSRDRLSSNI